MKKAKVFVVHSWETCDGMHHVHVWKEQEDLPAYIPPGSDQPETMIFSNWASALEAGYVQAQRLGLEWFQVDHPDFPHKFVRLMKTEDFKE